MEKQTTKQKGFNPIFKCKCGSISFNEGNGSEIIFICKKCGSIFKEVK